MTSKIEGTILGTAYGDAWGHEVEFFNHKKIIRLNHHFPENSTAYITDDTQMSLYVMQGIESLYTGVDQPDTLMEYIKLHGENPIRTAIADQFAIWLNDPLNNRAPGIASMEGSAIYANSQRITGLEGSDSNALGCGANMRSMWLGCLPLAELEVALLSQIQAEITHGHPLAGASSVITSLVVWHLINTPEVSELSGEELFDFIITICARLKNESIWGWRLEDPNWKNAYDDLSQWLREAKSKLPILREAVSRGEPLDLETLFGGGWIAPSALVNALAILAVSTRETALSNIQYLIETSGDSDSIAAIGGAFLGAKFGAKIFPSHWFSQIEPYYQDELMMTIDLLALLNE